MMINYFLGLMPYFTLTTEDFFLSRYFGNLSIRNTCIRVLVVLNGNVDWYIQSINSEKTKTIFNSMFILLFPTKQLDDTFPPCSVRLYSFVLEFKPILTCFRNYLHIPFSLSCISYNLHLCTTTLMSSYKPLHVMYHKIFVLIILLYKEL